MVDKDMYIKILNSEMILATGCTEPAAVALTAAFAALALRHAGGELEHLKVEASTNIIKNAMAAGIPGTPYTGMAYAAAIGATGGDADKSLEVINDVSPEALKKAEALVASGRVEVGLADTPEKLYIEVCAYGGGHTGRAIIRELHTNIALLEADGKSILRQKDSSSGGVEVGITPEEIAEFLTVKGIWEYATEAMDPVNDPIDIIRAAVQVNTEICDEGLSKDYGIAVGRNLERNTRQGIMTRDMTTNAMLITAAGADARMAGAPKSVVTNSGSGNQGITTTMPVVATARWLDVSEETMLRAVTLSNLIAIRVKSRFGVLSNLCGATVASTGAACGIVYLMDGGYEQICNAIHNMVGNVPGMVCDGAKADCAIKISTCVNAAFQAAAMALRGIRIKSTDGIVENDVEETLNNFATLSTQGTNDSTILHLMLNKRS